MEKVPLQEVWKEEKDFTGWLYDNLEVLDDELNLDLYPCLHNTKAGSFAADITAKDRLGREVLIQNQLEKTDDAHLGRILTCASNFKGKIIVWISSNPQPEHMRAFVWLNEAGNGVLFYLVKVGVYRIGSSKPAAKFDVVAGPSENAEMVGKEKKKEAEWHKLHYDL